MDQKKQMTQIRRAGLRIGVVAALAITLTTGLVGCGASAPMAATPTKMPDARALGADAETYPLGANAVSLEVEVHAGAGYSVHFQTIKGTLAVTPEDVLASHVEVTVETSSAASTLGMVADIAKSSQFLDTAQFPVAHFISRSFDKSKDKTGGIDLIGELELHGVQRPVRVPAELAVNECSVSFSTEFSINRRNYHVESNGSLDGVVADGVIVRIRANVPRKGRPTTCVDAASAVSQQPTKTVSPKIDTTAADATITSNRGG